MPEQPRNKILIIIIGILLITNIVMLGFLLGGFKQKVVKEDRKNNVAEYLEKEVGFNSKQLAAYDTLSKKHREVIKPAFREFSAGRKTILNSIAAAGFTDSAIQQAAKDIHDKQKLLEVDMLDHIREIRELCTAEQKQRFDTGFYKIFGRRGDNRKEK